MMKIGVLSDTHFDDLADGLAFLDHLCAGPFADVDLILHAGDIIHPDLLYCFESRPIFGVRGNCDEPAVDLPEKRLQEVAGFRFGMIHGWGGPNGIVGHVLSAFEDVPLDVLIFGHSHYPLCRQNGDLLLFNPGSATDRRDAPFHSVGILELTDVVKGEIVNLDISSG
jgi:putative phosphoesterase